ncbi:MAG: hypothetical protein OXU64_11525 [Gemmatimonadota bacterium]|nr:hypothetical protein [Gemmatimonadota bacterium]
MVEIGREDSMRAEDIMLDYVTWMESQEYAPGYIEDIVKALKSWLTYNYVDIRRKIKIANARIPVTLEDEQVPTPAQLESIMNAADPRTRACMSLMAFAGVRPQVIGNHDGTDGLRVSDIEGLRADGGKGGTLSLERTPATVTIRPQISKAGHRYFTFLTSQGCSYLLGYLRGRAAAGERMGPDSPLICTRRTACAQATGGQEFMSTHAVTLPIRAAIRSVTKARPYVLRAYFDTQLLLAESSGCMTHAYRQFFMGHTGDMEARYTTNKGRLTEQMVEDMRGAFARSEAFLRAGEGGDDAENRREVFLLSLRQQARAHGIDPSSIMVRTKSGGAKAASQDGAHGMAPAPTDIMPEDADPPRDGPRGAPYQTRIITGEEELLSRVAYGWDIVNNMPGGRFLIRRKTAPA